LPADHQADGHRPLVVRGSQVENRCNALILLIIIVSSECMSFRADRWRTIHVRSETWVNTQKSMN